MQMVDNYPSLKQSNTANLTAWIVCFSAALFFFYEFIQGNMFASIADNIMQDFHIDAKKMAYLSSIYYVSNVIFLVFAGIILDTFSTKKTILWAMSLCILSTFALASTHSFYLALLCRFSAGIGSAFCFLGPVRLAARWFPPKRMAMITGIIVTIAMTGGMLAQYPLTCLVAQVGWRNALMQIGWLGLIILGVMYCGIIDKPVKNSLQFTQFLAFKTFKKVYLNLQIIRAAAFTSLMNMGIAVFGAMMGSLYLIERLSIAKEQAALINSMLFLGAILGGPIIGWCSDKLNQRVLLMKIGAIAALMVIVSILFLPVSVNGMKGLFFLLGFFTAAQVISYALVAETNPAAVTAAAVSVVSILTQGGYIAYQNLFSLLLTYHHTIKYTAHVPYTLADYHYASFILPLGLGLALCLIWRLPEMSKSKKEAIGHD